MNSDLDNYLQSIHRVNYNMLCEVDRVCQKHKINYYLHGGTMLGMARHGDFIPWDDDVDISMPRADYERFKKVFEAETPENYTLIKYEDYNEFFDFITRVTDTDYMVSNLKADDVYYNYRYSHPCIDIFVYDNVSRFYKLQLFSLQIIYALAMGHRQNVSYEKYKGIKKIGAYIFPVLGKCISIGRLSKWYNYIAQMGKKPSKYWFISNEQANHPSWGLRYQKKWYKKLYMGKLGEKLFPCPKMYTDELKMIYNDYMSLPPEKDRVPEHFFLEKRTQNKTR
ncbi:MAG: LicD family protein [Lachnospiraceae bacterium]|nr:LicD family protein [Lachnospiraceae bacterium]